MTLMTGYSETAAFISEEVPPCVHGPKYPLLKSAGGTTTVFAFSTCSIVPAVFPASNFMNAYAFCFLECHVSYLGGTMLPHALLLVQE